MEALAALEAEANGTKPEKVKHKWTFLGWDPGAIPLTAFGRGDEFPAFFTWHAGLDKTLLDMMRFEFDKGMRPESFSNMILELHAKEYTRAWLKYEREISMARHTAETGLVVHMN